MSSSTGGEAMDEATRLVAELQSKLSELDYKVWQYRKEMLDQFTRHAAGVLKDAPSDIIEKVSQAIATDLDSYKTLKPTEAETHEAIKTTGTSGLGNDSDRATEPGYFSNPTTQTSEIRPDGSMDSPRSPHQRELELQGVFTPSYLPLLDSSNRNERSSPLERTVTIHKGKEIEEAISSPGVDASTDTRSLAASPEVPRPRPATPIRKNTDEQSVASVLSDHSDGPIRRSALRRSSSSHITQSPRRVRFEFQGSEVLPSASPQPQELIQTSESEPPLSISDSDEEDEPEQYQQVESPQTKNMSNTQRLRLLSRKPLDESTQWTAVSAPQDGSGSIVGGHMDTDSEDEEESGDESGLPPVVIPGPTSFRMADFQETSDEYRVPPPGIRRFRIDDIPEMTDSQNAEVILSEDDMIDMPPLQRSSKSEAPTSAPMNITAPEEPTLPPPTPSRRTLAPHNKNAPPTSRRKRNKVFILESSEDNTSSSGEAKPAKSEQGEFDGLFSFDESLENERPPSIPEEPEDADEDEETEMEQGAATGLDDLSRSPPIVIPPRGPTSPVEAPYNGIVGSYKGRSFTMPIVSDEIHAQAASLGNMNSFVGSVDGRSGMDESDMQSFRQSLRSGGGASSNFNGQPRSMSERMMMDDLREAEEADKEQS